MAIGLDSRSLDHDSNDVGIVGCSLGVVMGVFQISHLFGVVVLIRV